MKLGVLVCLGAALVCAQDQGTKRGGPGGRMVADLGLSATQQNTIHTVMADAQVQSKGLREQSRTLRDQLNAAVKAGDEGKIDQVTRDMANLDAQMNSIEAKAQAKIYGSLTADQKTKIDARPGGVGALMGRGGPRGGFGGPGPGTRRGGPPPAQ